MENKWDFLKGATVIGTKESRDKLQGVILQAEDGKEYELCIACEGPEWDDYLVAVELTDNDILWGKSFDGEKSDGE